ncbi:MAG: radical SAM protein [Aliarcobacter sp.]|jgi:radical SAM protein with 4Fe4S-binding SPASM domain|nr:radical SAM protein [Aliarcobacter sp.]
MKKLFYSMLGYKYKDAVDKQKNDAYIELSNICNAKCIFCPYPSIEKTDKKLQSLDEKTFDRILYFIKSLNCRKISFTPTTGEVFLNKNWHNFVQSALNMKFINKIHFYSNAILLNEKNITKLINLDNSNKIQRISFSVGGIDSITYKEMYKVDKFEKVKNNINLLNKTLKDKEFNTKISCEFRLNKNIKKFDKKTLNSSFNEINYKYFNIEILDKFANIKFAEASKENLVFLKRPIYTTPCIDLNTFRFAADGNIWLCGCVVSELPNDYSLKIGNVYNSTVQEILEKQKQIINKWSLNKTIPNVCKYCDIYTPRK